MFCRSEFEYLAGLLRSRTVGYNTLQAEVSNIKQTWSREKENGSRGLPVDFSIRPYSVAVSMAIHAVILFLNVQADFLAVNHILHNIKLLQTTRLTL